VRALTTSPEPDRKTAILDAAETAFADAGFEGASLRRIVREAGVNLATVYYYFESKEGLMLAVMDRRFRPLREEQLSGLEALEQAAADQPLAVEAILETLLLPTLRLVGTGSVRQEAVKRLIGRVVTEPNPQIQQLLVRPHSVMRAAFFKALHRSLPDLPMPDLVWRMEFIWGALGFILCNPAKMEMVTAGVCNPADTETVFQQMIRFFGTGLKAPPVSRQPAARRAAAPRRRKNP
jgi:AcrR family transcriptional regulator